ncbi:protein SODIUM POTASSIUM ROOT DEFECTIVE 2-like [Ipomoea triloba]|uniref:protein SODIUM POTASSIUM ROOT DEFECTIVE 2-like n=1 Tax=Ipomoea triloba TaxID=35885 RepID=UPI00125E65E1|nr:protein SODIUM POTASSIUM ROOT DEFECTIVE 2-like [Ipomoea triloba]GLL27690.1 heavy metal-associated isoprenylated plant protein 7-like [Ipomoea trifida]GMC98201.1 protein SODIUM POTASSIUM ROOT DEFECTIVE 2 [Ipomoea batatas]GME16900.1 protein SODIUM POTASSIUM ROOT DEFECTIVE 2 [Ipomoea batatas]
MRKLIFGKVLDCFSFSSGPRSCFCINGFGAEDDDLEKRPLIESQSDVIAGPATLALHLKPKVVVLRVSMHCNGCARKVKKHISKMEGVTSYEVDLETKMVMVMGDIVPFQVLESVSRVKNAEIWTIKSPI